MIIKQKSLEAFFKQFSIEVEMESFRQGYLPTQQTRSL